MRARSGRHDALLLAAAAVAFLVLAVGQGHYWDEYFYVYSAWGHSVGGLVSLESVVTPDPFPGAFFSAKIVFVALLRLLVRLTGEGFPGLYGLQAAFALALVAFCYVMWALFRELRVGEAVGPTLFLFFSPLTVYLGYKTLSEVPSLLLAGAGCVLFLRSLRPAPATRRGVVLAGAIAFLTLGILARITSILFAAGFGLGLLAWGPPCVDRRRVLVRGTLAGAGILGLLALTWTLLGIDVVSFGGLAASVTRRRPSPLVKVFAVGMSVQLFAPFVLAGLWKWREPVVRFALAWLVVTSVPFLLGARHAEPRYFYGSAPALALLAHRGLTVVARRPLRPAISAAVALGLGIAGRLALDPFMPYEIDQRAYGTFADRAAGDDGTLVTGWISDYAFLRFALPDRDVVLAYDGGPAGPGAGLERALEAWAGPEGYVRRPEELCAHRAPWVYVGWTFNPAVLALSERLAWWKLGSARSAVGRETLKDHLSLGWPWHAPGVRLREIADRDDYRAYRILGPEPTARSPAPGAGCRFPPRS
ncbi:MAG: hypothetical protein ACE5HF_01905 [Gemmatimonadota bacterium]